MTEQNAEQQAEASVSNEADVPVLISSVGEQLRQGREKAGLQIADVAQTLKLGARQIAALENGDWDSLPGLTFVRGFVRNYARLINLDPTPLMTQLDEVLAQPAHEISVPESSPNRVEFDSFGARDDRRFILFGLLSAIVAALIYFALPDDIAQLREDTQVLIDSLSRKEEAPVVSAAEPSAANGAKDEPLFPPGSTPQQIMNPQGQMPGDPAAGPVTSVTASSVAAAPAEKSPEATSTAALSFEIVRESWIEVRDRHDKVILSQRLLAGSQKAVSGDGPFSLVIGFAPGVKLQWRGQPVDLEPHTRGEVARLVLE